MFPNSEKFYDKADSFKWNASRRELNAAKVVQYMIYLLDKYMTAQLTHGDSEQLTDGIIKHGRINGILSK